jgi:hypothetical protein
MLSQSMTMRPRVGRLALTPGEILLFPEDRRDHPVTVLARFVR